MSFWGAGQSIETVPKVDTSIGDSGQRKLEHRAMPCLDPKVLISCEITTGSCIGWPEEDLGFSGSAPECEEAASAEWQGMQEGRSAVNICSIHAYLERLVPFSRGAGSCCSTSQPSGSSRHAE